MTLHWYQKCNCCYTNTVLVVERAEGVRRFFLFFYSVSGKSIPSINRKDTSK